MIAAIMAGLLGGPSGCAAGSRSESTDGSGTCPSSRLITVGQLAVPSDASYSSGPTSLAAADLNGDGKPDLVAVNSEGVSVLLGQGDGAFAAAMLYNAGYKSVAVVAADLNGDGWPDLAVVSTGAVFVLINMGGGSFDSPIEYDAGDGDSSGGAAVVAADLNGDGAPDLAVVNPDNVVVLMNQGDGTFAEGIDHDAGSEPSSVVAADLDGDGSPDLAVTADGYGESGVVVLANDGNATFRVSMDAIAGRTPAAIVATDLNGDGRIDLAVANVDSNDVSVIINTCSL